MPRKTAEERGREAGIVAFGTAAENCYVVSIVAIKIDNTGDHNIINFVIGVIGRDKNKILEEAKKSCKADNPEHSIHLVTILNLADKLKQQREDDLTS